MPSDAVLPDFHHTVVIVTDNGALVALAEDLHRGSSIDVIVPAGM